MDSAIARILTLCGASFKRRERSRGVRTVFSIKNSSTALDTGKGFYVFGGSLSSTQGNVFMGLSGELQGTIKFKGTFESPQITKVSLDDHARGGGVSAFLTIKLSASGPFVQGP